MSLEELLDSFADMLLANRATLWDLGDKLHQARFLYGGKVLGKFAETARCSKRWCQRLAKVSSLFAPEVRQQYADVSWSLFAVAAQTDNPASWLEQAAFNEWSEAELRRAIRGEKPVTPKVERILRQSERVFAGGGDEAEALEDGLRELLRGRG